MKIVQISTNTVPVPPIDYGGKQRDIYYLTEDLIRRGHEVILYAMKGSKSSAKTFEYPSDDPKQQLDFIIQTMPEDVDIIHDHYGIVAEANPPIPTIRNAHGYQKVVGQICVYVSKKMLKTIGNNKGYFVHNGIGLRDYPFSQEKEDFLLFLGRMEENKGVHLAIKVAKKTGRKLIIAGPIRKKRESEYFHAKIAPELNDQIIYIGSVGGEKKQQLLSKAYCVLFPSVWNEPFGLVPIEALACGTPVLALKYGAVPEVLKGMPKFLCKNTQEMITKMNYIKKLYSPEECRRYVEKNFTDQVMTDHFLQVYDKILREKEYKVIRNSEWTKRKKALKKE